MKIKKILAACRVDESPGKTESCIIAAADYKVVKAVTGLHREVEDSLSGHTHLEVVVRKNTGNWSLCVQAEIN
jgi:hypothetical protein